MPDLAYPRVTHAFYSTPWAILPEKLGEMHAFIEAKGRGVESPVRAWDDDDADNAAARRLSAGPRFQVVNRTAIINVFGVLSHRMNLFSEFSGGTSTELIGQQFDAALRDKSIRSILLRIDSPGGDVFGTEELARKIHAGRAEKKVIAVADAVAASAAYWLASQATEINITTSGQVGSIGVLTWHQDVSKAEEQAGVKTTLIYAGKYKVEHDSSLPLSAEGKDYTQSIVDKYYSMFVAAVARGRNVSAAKVEKEFGQGRMVLAKDAVERGMADRVATFEQVLGRLGADAASSASASAKAAGAVARAREMESA